jgi:hypothetical protein
MAVAPARRKHPYTRPDTAAAATTAAVGSSTTRAPGPLHRAMAVALVGSLGASGATAVAVAAARGMVSGPHQGLAQLTLGACHGLAAAAGQQGARGLVR